LELFDERGFDRTTVAQIAKRAGLAERSFYRYFGDKREVLFGGGEELERLLVEAVREAPAEAGTLDVLLGAVAQAARVFRPKDFLIVRARVVDANPELRERELRKMDAIYAALAGAVRERGAGETEARLATDLAMSAWRIAAERWVRGDDTTFAAEVDGVAEELRQVAAGITA